MDELVGEPVRWGILSTAQINDQVIGPLQQSATSELVAVASRSSDVAASYAAEKGIPRSFGSYQELLDDEDVEVVYISLPNSLHTEWIKASLEAGKHVLCEKPFTPTAREAEEVFDLASRRGLRLEEAVMYRHHPQTTRIQEIVANDLGEIRSIHAALHYAIPDLESDIRSQPTLAGGVMRDGGSYCVSIGNLLAGGEPSEVVGRVSRTGPGGIDVAFSAILLYANGITCSFDVSMDSPLSLWMVVTGSERSLRIPNPFTPSLTALWEPERCPAEGWLVNGGSEELVALPGENPFLHEIEDFSRAVRDGGGDVVPAAETVRNMRTIERLAADAGLPGA